MDPNINKEIIKFHRESVGCTNITLDKYPYKGCKLGESCSYFSCPIINQTISDRKEKVEGECESMW